MTGEDQGDDDEISEDEVLLLAQAVAGGNDGECSDDFSSMQGPMTPTPMPTTPTPMRAPVQMLQHVPKNLVHVPGQQISLAQPTVHKQRRQAQIAQTQIGRRPSTSTPQRPTKTKLGSDSGPSAGMSPLLAGGSEPNKKPRKMCAAAPPIQPPVDNVEMTFGPDLDAGFDQQEESQQENKQVVGEASSQSTWECCKAVETLKLGEAGSDAWKPPTSFKKEAAKTRWNAEVAKVLAWVPVLEKVLGADQRKVTEHELKTAVSQVKKLTSKKLDKRVEYEKLNGKNDALMSERFQALTKALEAAKDLRTLAVTSTKSPTTFSAESLEALMKKFHSALHILAGATTWVGLPSHWVQAGSGSAAVVTVVTVVQFYFL